MQAVPAVEHVNVASAIAGLDQTEAATTQTSRPTASAPPNTDQRRSIGITVAGFAANGNR